MRAPDIKRFSPDLTLASIDQMALVYFPARSPGSDDMAAMRAHLLEAAARSPSGFGLVLLIPPDAGPPEGKVREQAGEMFRSVATRLKIMAGVLEGGGFGAAAKRSVLTLLVNVVLGSSAVKVFATPGPGCDWAAQQARLARVESPPAVDLEACLEAMRRPQ